MCMTTPKESDSHKCPFLKRVSWSYQASDSNAPSWKLCSVDGKRCDAVDGKFQKFKVDFHVVGCKRLVWTCPRYLAGVAEGVT